jgi:hypothetical protein
MNSKFFKTLPASLVLATGGVSAQNLIPLYGATAGAVSDVAVTTTVPLPGDRAADVAAAMVSGHGDLELIAWQDTTTALEPLGGGHVAGATTAVAITGLDAHRVVTASYSGNFTVAVNVWKLGSSDSGVENQGSNQQPGFIGGSIGIARLSSTRVAVSFVDPSSNDLFVYAYDISSSGTPKEIAAWSVTGIADSGIGLLGITAVSSDMVMTAVRDLAGNLRVITWKISSSEVLDIDSYTAGAVKKVSISGQFGAGSVMTSSVNSLNGLENIYWSISSSGHITRGDTAILGEGHVTDSAGVWSPEGLRVTAIRSAPGGFLDLERWQDPFLASNGEIGDYASSTPISMVALASEGAGPAEDHEIQNYFVTAARSSAGDLEVEVFKTSQTVTPPPP